MPRTRITPSIISGNQAKKVIVRALGPTLSTLGLSGALADPTMTIGSRKKWNDGCRVGRGLPAALTGVRLRKLSGSAESRPGNEFRELRGRATLCGAGLGLNFYPAINRQLSALGLPELDRISLRVV